jgi:hypothetical protein
MSSQRRRSKAVLLDCPGVISKLLVQGRRELAGWSLVDAPDRGKWWLSTQQCRIMADVRR